MAIEMSNIVRSAQRLKEPGSIPQVLPTISHSTTPSMNNPPHYPPPHRDNFYDNHRSRSAYNQVGPQNNTYDNPSGNYNQRPPPRTSYNLY